MLHDTIVEQLKRLGREVPDDLTGSAVEILVNQIDWQGITLHTPLDRLRADFIDRGFDDEGWSDDMLIDKCLQHGPQPTNGLELTAQGASFEEFENTDSSVTVPWGEDDAYLYMLKENEADPSDPLVFVLDHEELDAEPWHNGLTVSRWSRVLVQKNRRRRDPRTGQWIDP